MNNHEKRDKLLSTAAILFLVVVLIVNLVAMNNLPKAGEIVAEEVPDEAVVLVGTADGRNGPVKVEVTATKDAIFGIRVLEQVETDGIGSVAVQKIPAQIFETQSLMVDSVSGATVTSDAIKAGSAPVQDKNEQRMASDNSG